MWLKSFSARERERESGSRENHIISLLAGAYGSVPFRLSSSFCVSKAYPNSMVATATTRSTLVQSVTKVAPQKKLVGKSK